MDFGYAVTYVFEDRKWVQKLVVLTVLSFISSMAFAPLAIPVFIAGGLPFWVYVVLVPMLLIGIPALIVTLGYMLRIAKNVRGGLPRPLPEWKNMSDKFKDGSAVLLAIFVYNLPLMLIGFTNWALIGSVLAALLGGGATFFTICCTLPLTIVYTAFAWPLLATGVSEYMETGQARALYRFVHLWDALRANTRVVQGWALSAVMLNFALGLLLIIPCLGWLLVAIFGIPVHGHLFGQFAHQLSLTNKPKPQLKGAPKRK